MTRSCKGQHGFAVGFPVLGSPNNRGRSISMTEDPESSITLHVGNPGIIWEKKLVLIQASIIS